MKIEDKIYRYKRRIKIPEIHLLSKKQWIDIISYIDRDYKGKEEVLDIRRNSKDEYYHISTNEVDSLYPIKVYTKDNKYITKITMLSNYYFENNYREIYDSTYQEIKEMIEQSIWFK